MTNLPEESVNSEQENTELATDASAEQTPETVAETNSAQQEAQEEQRKVWWEDKKSRDDMIAGIVKTAKEKAYRKGREEALRSLNQDQSQGQEYQQPQYQEQLQQQPSVNEEFTRRRIASIDSRGQTKYEDFNDRVLPLRVRAEQEASQFGDSPTLLMLSEACQLPEAEDVIYRMSKSPEKMQELLKYNPVYWRDEIYKAFGKPEPTVQAKAANSPVKEVKAPPAEGGNNLTDAALDKLTIERRRNNRR